MGGSDEHWNDTTHDLSYAIFDVASRMCFNTPNLTLRWHRNTDDPFLHAAKSIGSARINENGKAYGGKAGDQTGMEVSTQNWYLHSLGWGPLRAKSAEQREKIALCMEAACNNKHIGYDQWARESLYNEAEKYGFDVSRVTKDVECDCSALVRVCCAFAGIKVASFNTASEVGTLMASGAFDNYTDADHCSSSRKLLRGDILVTKEKGHTVVVLTDGADADRVLGMRVLEKGMAGSDVKEMLMALGYDLGPCKADSDFGSVTEKAVRAFQKDCGISVTGKYTAETHKALMGEKAAGETTGKTVTLTGNVNIQCGNDTEYKVITSAAKGSVFSWVATAENGWMAVVVNGQVGWVSGQYAVVK